jgi:hypothetical protein
MYSAFDHSPKFLLTFAVVVFLIGGSANAEEGVWTVGYQSTTCGAWTKERREHSFARAAYEGWITGFLSGLAIAQKSNQNPLAGVDADAIYAWIDNYCSARPLDILSVASFALMKELLARTKSAN